MAEIYPILRRRQPLASGSFASVGGGIARTEKELVERAAALDESELDALLEALQQEQGGG